MELVLHLGEPFSRHDEDGRVQRQPAQLLAGQITTAIVLQPSTTMDVWGIRFHPWAGGRLSRPAERGASRPRAVVG